MRRKEQLNSIIEICPVRNVVARFGNKWALLVILVLSENEPIRYNELGRKIPDISSRVLSNTLRILEADGLVDRRFYQEVPPRVEYSLTDTGRSLVPIIIKLTEWAQNNMKTIIEHRNQKSAVAGGEEATGDAGGVGGYGGG
ncbi:MAG: helix-turn-helix transcriptional regulator [Paramuribaculum sp.]|nr:helix-turn-helix transcriptional regulator [Paramuribaculum sp.]